MADLYRVLLTEGRYTTEKGPFDKATAMSQFEEGAPCCGPSSGSFFRVVTEDEYRRIWPRIAQSNESSWAEKPLCPCGQPDCPVETFGDTHDHDAECLQAGGPCSPEAAAQPDAMTTAPNPPEVSGGA